MNTIDALYDRCFTYAGFHGVQLSLDPKTLYLSVFKQPNGLNTVALANLNRYIGEYNRASDEIEDRRPKESHPQVGETADENKQWKKFVTTIHKDEAAKVLDILKPAPDNREPSHDEKLAEMLKNAPSSAHYQAEKIRSIDFNELNGLSFCEGNVVKYVSRWKRKDGLKDLRKAEFYIQYIIALEEKRLAEDGK